MYSEMTTIILYFSITIVTFFFALISNKRIKYKGIVITHSRIIFFIFSWAIATFFLVGSHIGTDYISYINILKNVKWENVLSFTNAEPGFKILWLIFKEFNSNPDLFLGIIKFTGITLAFISIWKSKNYINVGYAVLGYMCFVYFDSFNLIRMIFAVNIAILSFGKVLKGKNIQAIIIAFIAITMHTGSLFFLLALFAYSIFNKLKRVSKIMYLLFALFLFGCLMGVGSLYNYLVGNISIFNHYTKYTLSTAYSFSPILIIRYVPNIYCVYYSWGKLKEKNIEKLGFVFAITAVFVSLLSYSIKTVTRANSFFYVFQIIYIPYFLNIVKMHNWDYTRNNKRCLFNYRDSCFIIFIYDLLFFSIKMTELTVSEIQHYSFFW